MTGPDMDWMQTLLRECIDAMQDMQKFYETVQILKPAWMDHQLHEMISRLQMIDDFIGEQDHGC